MLIYVIRNEHQEEVAAYTNHDEARLVAEELQSLSQRPYHVEAFTGLEDHKEVEGLSFSQ